VDSANVHADAVGAGHGLSSDELEALAGRIAEAHDRIEAGRGRDVGFMVLPYDGELADRIKEKAREVRERATDFVVLGIGGSALGNIAAHAALAHPFHNLLPDAHPGRNGAPRIFVLDNVDPALMTAFLDAIEGRLDRTIFNVITKSGSTAETMSQFLFARDLLRRNGCDPATQIIATTDPSPEQSLLRHIAEQDGYCTLPIPPNVGGRFSVLSAVGLMSAAVGGVDIDEMLAGAAAMDQRCRESSLQDNPAALYAAILYLFYQKGKPITVLMPYSSALGRLADWYCQLWAESLGKRDGLEARDIFAGPTPVGAVGVTDQHSVMQLESEAELSYLAGSTFGRLLGAELAATRRALRDKQRPNMTLRIPRVTPRALGELFMFFEYAVTYSGLLYGVNAFDQPGVELGKQYTYGLMGREGFAPPEGLSLPPERPV
jgi:glucose-6-phosphate isomerase